MIPVCPISRKSRTTASLKRCKYPIHHESAYTNIFQSPLGSDWASVASRSLTPPWVPRLISTHQVGLYHIEPTIFTGDKYTAGDDPFPRFSYRVVSSSLSPACGRRQQVFSIFEGCAPLMSLDAGSSCVEEVECHSLTRRHSL